MLEWIKTIFQRPFFGKRHDYPGRAERLRRKADRLSREAESAYRRGYPEQGAQLAEAARIFREGDSVPESAPLLEADDVGLLPRHMTPPEAYDGLDREDLVGTARAGWAVADATREANRLLREKLKRETARRKRLESFLQRLSKAANKPRFVRLEGIGWSPETEGPIEYTPTDSRRLAFMRVLLTLADREVRGWKG